MTGMTTPAINNSVVIKYENGRRDIVRKTGEDSYNICHAPQEGIEGGFSSENVAGKDNMYKKINLNSKNGNIDSVTLIKENGSSKTYTLNEDYTINCLSTPQSGVDGACLKKLSYFDGIEALKNIPKQLGISKLFERQ